MTKNVKIILTAVMMIIAVSIMMAASTPNAGSTEVNLVDAKKADKDKLILTQGLLDETTVNWDTEKLQLSFTVKDELGKNPLNVTYNGVKPDNFSKDVIVIVEGYMNGDIFEAEKLQTKCPSKYEGEDPKNYNSNLHKEIYKENKK